MAAGDVESFGKDADGKTVERVTLAGSALRASVISWGASVQQLLLEGHDSPLTLGFERIEDYLPHPLFYGATAGRYANRVAQARFTLHGERFQGDTNEPSANTLHGG